jgi:Spermine/spermidine synthase domain
MPDPGDRAPARRDLIAVACTSGTLLMIELALTRIFSVVMYYHFAFLAISIALFGLSASGVFAYVFRSRLARRPAADLLARGSLLYAVCTLVALFFLVRLRVGLNYSPRNLVLMLTIYALAALPFLSGGFVITMAISRLSSRINAVYAADLVGAAGGCLVLIPLLNRLGAPGVVLVAVILAVTAAVLFAAPGARSRCLTAGAVIAVVPLALQFTGIGTFDITATKGHQGDRVLFSKWNSFSRIGVYERQHGDWSLSNNYNGPVPETRFMDIDSAASTPILHVEPNLSNAQYLRYELTAFAYHLKEIGGQTLEPGGQKPEAREGSAGVGQGFTALVIGPGGGRDLVSALVFGASHVDAVEINPIIADDVMRRRFREYSGGIYDHPKVRVTVDDGRSFVRRSDTRYDVIQASLVDTWAATAAGAYTLTENTLYTVDAFNDYLDHLTDGGVLTITRWVFDGLRLVSLAQAACESRGWTAAPRLAIVQNDQVATFMLKRTPFTARELATLRETADRLGFKVLYAPPGLEPASGDWRPDNGEPEADNDYARLVRASDRARFYREFPQDIRPTTDDRPFFFHTTKLRDQFQVAFGRSMLFGNGLSALLTLMAISAALVVLFVVGPLALAGGVLPRGWPLWLAYFAALGGGFMLLEVAVLQHFVLLLGHPVYSLTVTLFSLLLGTGLGAAVSRRFSDAALPRAAQYTLAAIVVIAVAFVAVVTPVINWAIPFERPVRILLAVAVILPIGMVLGVPMPAGIRLLSARSPEMLTWAWGMNGAFSVVGATLAIFIAMNWGFQTTLFTSAGAYLVGLAALRAVSR